MGVVVCGQGVFFAGCMRVGLAFSKFVNCKGGRDWIRREWFVIGDWRGKVGIGFYMCLCGWWRQVIVLSRAGANSMIIAWDGYRGLGNSGFRNLLIQGRCEQRGWGLALLIRNC